MLPSLLWFLFSSLSGCGSSEDTSVSSKARVMPKSGVVWGRDLAAGLGLAERELCQELGIIDCLSEAHLITLWGVEPATLGIDEPLPNTSVSAPMAADRVAVAACSARWSLDHAGSPVIFGPVIDKDSAGRRKDVAETLVKRLLERDPDKDEIDALLDLYDIIEPMSKDPARDWSVGACLTVATSTEALFY